MLSGGCFCGSVRYEVARSSIFDETLCHCSICRRTSGAPAVAWFTVPAQAFQVVQGSPSKFQSTPQGTRSFCGACGTLLSFQHRDFPTEIDVTTCSLDHPERVPPKDHTFVASKLHWLKLADGLPVYEEDSH